MPVTYQPHAAMRPGSKAQRSAHANRLPSGITRRATHSFEHSPAAPRHNPNQRAGRSLCANAQTKAANTPRFSSSLNSGLSRLVAPL